MKYKIGDLVEIDLYEDGLWLDVTNMSDNFYVSDQNLYTHFPYCKLVFSVLEYNSEQQAVKILIPFIRYNNHKINHFDNEIRYLWLHEKFVSKFNGSLCVKCGYACKQHCQSISRCF